MTSEVQSAPMGLLGDFGVRPAPTVAFYNTYHHQSHPTNPQNGANPTPVQSRHHLLPHAVTSLPCIENGRFTPPQTASEFDSAPEKCTCGPSIGSRTFLHPQVYHPRRRNPLHYHNQSQQQHYTNGPNSIPRRIPSASSPTVNGISIPNFITQNRSTDVMLRRAHGLMERFKSRASLMKLEDAPQQLLNGGACDLLNKAMWDLFHISAQREETYLNKLNLWRDIFLHIRKFLHNYGLFLVGSTMSGFGLERSDIDMCLLTKPMLSDPWSDSLQHLEILKQLLLKDGLAAGADLISAKVPILKFKHPETGFEVDLNCNNAVGIRNTHLLHTYARLDWRVRPLVVIVKLWAQANGINDAKNMTISSYSWALMVIHYLQCGVSPAVLPCLHQVAPDKFSVDCCSDSSHHHQHSLDVQEELEFVRDYKSDNSNYCLGDLFIGFLHYYAYFNYQLYAISVRTGSRLPVDECRFMKSPKNDPSQWKCLCIEEPFDLSNTARSVYDIAVFKRIKDILMGSYKELVHTKMLHHIMPLHPSYYPNDSTSANCGNNSSNNILANSHNTTNTLISSCSPI